MKNILKTVGLCGLLLACGCAGPKLRITDLSYSHNCVFFKSEYNRSALDKKFHPTYVVKVESSQYPDFRDFKVDKMGKYSEDKLSFVICRPTNNPSFYRLAFE